VRINRDSRSWIIVCLALWIGATVVYVQYYTNYQKTGGPSGGTWYGIIFGSVGSAMMLFALLLGLKKRVRTMRIGRAYHWMQGHVWFGLLAYPIILYHCGFRWGGPFTQVLMWMFTIVVVSGIIGIFIQQYMPTKMLHEVVYETIFDQIDHIVDHLREEAQTIVDNALHRTSGQAFEVEVVPAGATTTTMEHKILVAERTFSEFYTTQVKPFLERQVPKKNNFKTELAARVMFEQIRSALPRTMHEALNDLASVVEERRQLLMQRRMHHVLHGWLIVHVPLSYALMLLAAFHAVWDLRYVRPHW
jgi:hypothetical protein